MARVHVRTVEMCSATRAIDIFIKRVGYAFIFVIASARNAIRAMNILLNGRRSYLSPAQGCGAMYASRKLSGVWRMNMMKEP